MKTLGYLLVTLAVMLSFTINQASIALERGSHLKIRTRNQLTEQIREYLTKEMSKEKIAGLSVAIVDSAGVLLSDGLGYADRENGLRADSRTVFPIASITKTFTGIAVMQLVEKGLVDLDKPVAHYIPELSLPNGEENLITTRMLLTHHSGIHGDILYNWYLPTVSKNPLVYEEIVDLINETGTIFPPGKLHSYSNAGYSLLGVLIHNVSGKGYVEYVRSQIFEPLGMENSMIFAGEQTDAVISKGYFRKESTSMPMKLGIPAGGIALTSDDAATYLTSIIDAYHEGNSLLKSETMKQMMTWQNDDIPLDEGFSMGLTWFLEHPANEVTKYVAHRGELPPYHSMMVILPDLKIGVYVCVNTNKAADVPGEMAHKIAKDLYRYRTGRSIPKPGEKEEIFVSKEYLKQYEGVYPNVYFGPMKVLLKGKKLVVKSPVMPTPLVLIPLEDTTFSLKARMLGINFSVSMLDALKVEFRKYRSETYMYFIIQNSMLNPNLKIEPFALPGEYERYAGKYRVINMENSDRVVKDIQIDIRKNRNFALFKYTFLGRHQFNMVLQPIDGQHAKFAGIGYFTGDKIRWETQDGRILMYWSGLELEQVK
mgnify:CR=1 FL=1